MSTTQQTKQFKISLGDHDAQNLKQIADALNIKESEVMRKGLQLMALYAQTKKDGESSLVLKNGDKSQELLVL